MTNASDFQAEHLATPSSITPTRHAQQNPMADFTSTSAYLNHDPYAHSPNTPHGSLHLHDGTYTNISPVDETFAFAYGDYTGEGFMPMPPMDHSTPSAPIDDSTPIIPEIQHPLHASSFPCPPNIHGDETIRASHSHRPLMSPFQQDMMVYPGLMAQQRFIDPSTAFYPPNAAYVYPSGSSQDSFMPQYVNMHPTGVQIYPPPPQYYAPPPQSYEFHGPPRSRNGSPTGSVASSVASLARSGSTSSELRQARPKVKLTHTDKRNIVELHRANSSLRQEDIARQYG